MLILICRNDNLESKTSIYYQLYCIKIILHEKVKKKKKKKKKKSDL